MNAMMSKSQASHGWRAAAPGGPLLDALAQPVVLLDGAGRVVFANEAARSLPAARRLALDAGLLRPGRLPDDIRLIRLSGESGAAVALIFPALPPAPPRLDRFGLTRREAEVVARLANGERLREAAGLLGIGYETARTHLARAMSKAGVRCQASLVRQVMGGMA
jgi:DNA-binding CsgD family transcriptional regulator